MRPCGSALVRRLHPLHFLDDVRICLLDELAHPCARSPPASSRARRFSLQYAPMPVGPRWNPTLSCAPPELPVFPRRPDQRRNCSTPADTAAPGQGARRPGSGGRSPAGGHVLQRRADQGDRATPARLAEVHASEPAHDATDEPTIRSREVAGTQGAGGMRPRCRRPDTGWAACGFTSWCG